MGVPFSVVPRFLPQINLQVQGEAHGSLCTSWLWHL